MPGGRGPGYHGAANEKALFIGGPRNGEWHKVTGPVLMVLNPVKMDITQYLAPKPEDKYTVPLPERTEYIADMVDLFGYRLHVMVAYREMDRADESRSAALLKAVLQRDVVQALGIK